VGRGTCAFLYAHGANNHYLTTNKPVYPLRRAAHEPTVIVA